MKILNAAWLGALALTMTAPELAAAGSSSKHHKAMNMEVATGGQAAFAEIAQIVAELQADPKTDWSKVDIDGLRAHLIDMNNVTLHAQVSSQEIESGAIFTVSGQTEEVIQSIKAMTLAHGMMMAAEGLDWASEELENGAVVTITAEYETGADMVRGLGLFGLMTLGDHHALHHRMMATGQGHH